MFILAVELFPLCIFIAILVRWQPDPKGVRFIQSVGRCPGGGTMNAPQVPQRSPFSSITLLSHLSSKNAARPAPKSNKQFTKKKFALFSYPYHIPAKTPLILLPIDVLRKNPPIIKAVNRGGLSLLTSERPIGLRQSSPTVITP